MILSGLIGPCFIPFKGEQFKLAHANHCFFRQTDALLGYLESGDGIETDLVKI